MDLTAKQHLQHSTKLKCVTSWCFGCQMAVCSSVYVFSAEVLPFWPFSVTDRLAPACDFYQAGSRHILYTKQTKPRLDILKAWLEPGQPWCMHAPQFKMQPVSFAFCCFRFSSWASFQVLCHCVMLLILEQHFMHIDSYETHPYSA